MAREKFGRDPRSVKVLALVTPILGKTEEEALKKVEEYRGFASTEGALALFGGWTGIDLDQYGDEEELRHVESNAVRWGFGFFSVSYPLSTHASSFYVPCRLFLRDHINFPILLPLEPCSLPSIFPYSAPPFFWPVLKRHPSFLPKNTAGDQYQLGSRCL